MTETKEKETEQRPQPLTLKRLLSALSAILLLLSSLTVTATAMETPEAAEAAGAAKPMKAAEAADFAEIAGMTESVRVAKTTETAGTPEAVEATDGTESAKSTESTEAPADTKTGAKAIPVVLNGKELAFDTEPEIKNGSLFVPLRSIFEELGAEVEWSAARQEAYLTSGSEEICLKVGSAVAIHNTDVTLLTDPPYLKEGRTMIPLRYLGESLGYDVSWDKTARTARIDTSRRADSGATTPVGEPETPAGDDNASDKPSAGDATGSDKSPTNLDELSAGNGKPASLGEGNALSILGEAAGITYNEAIQSGISADSGCKSARLSLKQAQQQLDEFYDLYSLNYTIAIMHSRKDLDLLADWSERNVVVTEEQTAYRIVNAMDEISLKTAGLQQREEELQWAQKELRLDQLKYDAGAISRSALEESRAAVEDAQRQIQAAETELTGLYIQFFGSIGKDPGEFVSAAEQTVSSVEQVKQTASSMKQISSVSLVERTASAASDFSAGATAFPEPEFSLDYQSVKDSDPEDWYREIREDDPYLWYLKNSVDNADFKLQTYEYNVGGKSYTLTQMDLTKAKINYNATEANLKTTVLSRYNQLLQIEEQIEALKAQRETLRRSIDTMRTLYENGMQPKQALEDLLQNKRTITYNLLSLQISHCQLRTLYEKPYLAPEYMVSG